MNIKRIIQEHRKAVIALTLLSPFMQILIATARFGPDIAKTIARSSGISLVSFALGGFVLSICLFHFLEQAASRLSRRILMGGFVLTYPLFLIVGLFYGLLVGPLAPLIAAILQGGLLWMIFRFSRRFDS